MPESQSSPTMHFHCLHGAWHGAWVWDEFATLLQQHGATVTAPDLPGLGKRISELSRGIDLESHIDAAQPQQPGWIVAHSYAGMIAKAVCDRWPNKVNGVVLIEALWPHASGQCVIDLLSSDAVAAINTSAASNGNGWKIPPPAVKQFAINDPHIENQIENQLTDHPLATYTQGLNWTSKLAPELYLIASDRNPQPYADIAKRLEQAGTKVVAMSGGHHLMLTNATLVLESILQTIESKT